MMVKIILFEILIFKMDRKVDIAGLYEVMYKINKKRLSCNLQLRFITICISLQFMNTTLDLF